MFLSFRYRIYPLRGQAASLEHILREVNFLWNYALAQRQDAWIRERRTVTYLDQQARLKGWRAFDVQGLGAVPYAVARDSLQRLDLGYRAAFRRIREGQRRAGFPRFRRETISFSFIPVPEPFVNGPARSLRLKVPTVAPIPIRRHRPPPPGGTTKAVTIAREADGWYATIQYEIPNSVPPPETDAIVPVGVDLGLKHLATLSNGEAVDPPRFFREAERRLKREQRRLSRQQRGSRRYLRQRERVVLRHAKVRRQRRWLAHQLSRAWAERFDLVSFENMDFAGFRKGNRLAKGMADAGWGLLRQMTEYKLRLTSGRYVEVPARGTSQTCSACGRRAHPLLTLSDRIYRCPCGLTIDRDVNAARNILARGLKAVGMRLRPSRAEVTRAVSGPPPSRGGRRVYQRRRAGSVKREASRSGPRQPTPPRLGLSSGHGRELLQIYGSAPRDSV